MPTIEQNTVDKITQLGSDAVQGTITEYTLWYFFNSVAWIVFGVVICAYAIRLWKINQQNGAKFAALGVLFIGMLFISANIPTLFTPKGYAIHQFLKDIKP